MLLRLAIDNVASDNTLTWLGAIGITFLVWLIIVPLVQGFVSGMRVAAEYHGGWRALYRWNRDNIRGKVKR
jgi:hypothetical protein